MKLHKKWMYGGAVMALLAGTPESYGVLDAYQTVLKKKLESQRPGHGIIGR